MKKEKKFFNSRQVTIEAGSTLCKPLMFTESIKDRKLLLKAIGEPTLTGWNYPALSFEEGMKLLEIEVKRTNQIFDRMVEAIALKSFLTWQNS